MFCISKLFISCCVSNETVFKQYLTPSGMSWAHTTKRYWIPNSKQDYSDRSLSALYNSTKIMCTLCFYLLKMSWLVLLPVYPAMIDKCTLAFLVLWRPWLCKDQLLVICWCQGNTFLLTDVFSWIWNFKYNKPSSQNHFEYIA